MYQDRMYNHLSMLFGSLHFGYLELLGPVSLALHRHGHLKKLLSRQTLEYMYPAHMYNHLHSSTVVEAITKTLLPPDLLL